jgi:integrase
MLAGEKKYRDVFRFGFETGLRPGELCAAKVKDVNLLRRTMLVQRTYSGKVVKETTKEATKRHIPLSETAMEIAARHCRDKHPEAFLFVNESTGRGYSTESLRRTWKLYSPLKVTHYEAGRHTFCTMIAEAGASDLQAMALMRHSDIRSTQVYTHQRTDTLRDLVNRRGKGVQ